MQVIYESKIIISKHQNLTTYKIFHLTSSFDINFIYRVQLIPSRSMAQIARHVQHLVTSQFS